MGDLISNVLMPPMYEDPVNSVNDLVEKNITVFDYQRTANRTWIHLKSLQTTEWNTVADNMQAYEKCNYGWDFTDESRCDNWKYEYHVNVRKNPFSVTLIDKIL